MLQTFIIATSWADIPNWPQIPIGTSSTSSHAPSSEDKPSDSSTTASSENNDSSTNRRSDGDVPTTSVQDVASNSNDPEPANISWFRTQDYDASGFLSIDELMVNHQVRLTILTVRLVRFIRPNYFLLNKRPSLLAIQAIFTI